MSFYKNYRLMALAVAVFAALANQSWAADPTFWLLTDSQEVAAATSGDRVKLSKIFRQIIRNPGNIELNIQYAKLAEKTGAPRRALAAYERIQASHPNNQTAIDEIDRLRKIIGLAEIARKKKTNFFAVLGGRFETNAARRETEFSSFDSAAASVLIGAQDDRMLADQRIKTSIAFLGDFHNRYTDGDLMFIGADTGPVFDLSNTVTLHTAIGGSYARLDKLPFLHSTFVKLDFEDNSNPKVKQNAEIQLGYTDFAGRFDGRDGLYVGASSNVIQGDNIVAGDSLRAKVRYRYTHATGDTHFNRNHDYSIAGGYLYPIYDKVLAGGNLKLTYRDFVGRELAEDDTRWDYQIDPDLRLVFRDLLFDKSTLTVKYEFERNWSNEGDKTFLNHIIGAKLGWTF